MGVQVRQMQVEVYISSSILSGISSICVLRVSGNRHVPVPVVLLDVAENLDVVVRDKVDRHARAAEAAGAADAVDVVLAVALVSSGRSRPLTLGGRS